LVDRNLPTSHLHCNFLIFFFIFVLQVWQAIERVLQEENSSLQQVPGEEGPPPTLGHAYSGLRASRHSRDQEDTPTFAQLAPVSQETGCSMPQFPVISLKVGILKIRYHEHISYLNTFFFFCFLLQLNHYLLALSW
jgi:hypothetical protein